MAQQSDLTAHWCVFGVVITTFVIGVEVLHRTTRDQNLIYQRRILIDKDLAITEEPRAEESQPREVSFYERTHYGMLPKRQRDNAKIFRAYSAQTSYDGKYVKAAILVEDATVEKVKAIIDTLKDSRVSFVIPHYSQDLSDIATAIISSGNEFFIQLPTQTSIPEDKQDQVSPFLANADPQYTIDKLNYLIASVKYAIGIANTSSSLITKSPRNMKIIANELSHRGLAFFNIEEDNEVLKDILHNTNLLCLKAQQIEKVSQQPIVEKESVIINSSQLEDLLQKLPQSVRLMPISFKVNE